MRKLLAILGLIALTVACTQRQLEQVKDVRAQAKTVCETRMLERLAPIMLTTQQAEVTLEAARYACAAAESQCIDEVVRFREEQQKLQPADAGTPVPAEAPAPPSVPAPPADAAQP